MKNSEESAFPSSEQSTDGHNNLMTKVITGLTKREWMVTKILSGLCSDYGNQTSKDNEVHKYMVENAIRITDELLKQLNG